MPTLLVGGGLIQPGWGLSVFLFLLHPCGLSFVPSVLFLALLLLTLSSSSQSDFSVLSLEPSFFMGVGLDFPQMPLASQNTVCLHTGKLEISVLLLPPSSLQAASLGRKLGCLGMAQGRVVDTAVG